MGKRSRVWDGTAWIDLVGMRGPAAYAPINFGYPGNLVVTTASMPFMFVFDAVIVGVSAVCNVAPTGAAVVMDINKNGTTIFTTQANRPTIAIGQLKTTGIEVTNMDISAYAAGDVLTAHIDQIGSTITGADLTVSVRYESA